MAAPKPETPPRQREDVVSAAIATAQKKMTNAHQTSILLPDMRSLAKNTEYLFL